MGQISSTISEAVMKVSGALDDSKNCVSVSKITEDHIIMEIKVSNTGSFYSFLSNVLVRKIKLAMRVCIDMCTLQNRQLQ